MGKWKYDRGDAGFHVLIICIAILVALMTWVFATADPCGSGCQNERDCQDACATHGLEFECADYSYGSFGPTIKECWCWDEENGDTVQLW